MQVERVLFLAIVRIFPRQTAAFDLAHAVGHQLGLLHQNDTNCRTNHLMSAMTETYPPSFENAVWTKCENDRINNFICDFPCLFNKPFYHKPIKNKYSKLPGQKVSNDQQAKLLKIGSTMYQEMTSYRYRPTNLSSRCLHFQYDKDESDTGEIVSVSQKIFISSIISR